MKKITDIFAEKKRTISFEFFPPKTPAGRDKLIACAADLQALGADFFSVTYGAGGSTRENTLELVDELQQRFKVPTMHHFTCICHGRNDIARAIGEMRERNICNILALRGDLPQDGSRAADGVEYSYQLCELIRSSGAGFAIGVAGFPEGHITCPDRDLDARYLRLKLDHGGEFVITQLFFDNRDYFEYVQRLRKLGVTQRIIPGILPIGNYQTLVKFCSTCGVTIPARVHEIFRPLQEDEQKTVEAGIAFAIEQCRDLLAGGAPGFHFYTLNKSAMARRIIPSLPL